MARYVVDTSVILHMLQNDIDVSARHRLVAPTLLRSQVLEALYDAARTGRMSRDDALRRHGRFSTLKIRYLGDKVLRRRAWEVAEQMGWESTGAAEYVALTMLQADALITRDRDLARAVAGVVELGTVEDLT